MTCVNPDPKLIDEDQLNETLPEDMLIFCYRCHVNPKDGLVPRTTTSSQIYEGIAINETLRHELSRNFILKDFNIVDNDPISLKMRNLSGSNFWKLFAGPDETPNFISASTSELPITTTLLPGVPTRLNNFWANQVFGHVDTETDTVLSSTTKENPNSLSIEGTNDITNTPTPIEISTSTLETTSTTTTIFETMPSFTDKQELKGTKSTKNMPLRFSLTNINDIPNRGRANAFQDVIPTKESDQGNIDGCGHFSH